MGFSKLIGCSLDSGFYFCGCYNGNVILGKIDSLGSMQWVKEIGSTQSQEIPWDLTVLQNGNVAIMI